VFGIVWLRGGVPIERETSVLTNESEAIAAAESHVTAVSRSRHHQPEPRLGGVPIDRPVALFRIPDFLGSAPGKHLNVQ
jgi:hypothetical protein